VTYWLAEDQFTRHARRKQQMRILVRHTKTGSYFQGLGTWTDDPDEAYDFRFKDRAIQHIKTWDLNEVELVFAFSDPVSITPVALDRVASRCVV